MSRDLCLILDFGSPYAQLITRRVREHRVYSEIHPFNIDIGRIRSLSPKAIIISDDLSSFSDAPTLAQELYDLGVPILRIPEVADVEPGSDVLANFLFRVADFSPSWTMASFLDEAVGQIRAEVDDGQGILGLSGGVDSWVTAVLVERAIHDQLSFISIDNGFLRRGERASVESVFRDMFKSELRVIDASERFLAAVTGAGPADKRKRIQGEYIALFEEEATRIGNVQFIARGTIYSDVISSILYDGTSITITQPYDVAEPRRSLNLRVLEPLRRLFKNEVRELGELLGLPGELLRRQPFPFPGLAVRCVGDVTPSRLEILQTADAIMEEEIRAVGLYHSIWQSFAVLLRDGSYGRGTRNEVISLRAVDSDDGTTAEWVSLPPEVLRTISRRIMDEVPLVGRVVYDITPKPPGRIEWE
jgi:GMP synthase (glutamine-hydrolysing)